MAAVLCWLLAAEPVWAQSAAPPSSPEFSALAQKIQKKYEEIKELKASFTQETYIKSLDQKRRLQGEVYLKKPGKMRWDYFGESPQHIIADGRTLWFYQEKDRTVMSGDLKGSLAGRVPFDFLSGLGNLRRDFQITPSGDATTLPPDRSRLDLIPREPLVNISRLSLEISLSDHLVRRVTIYDPFGNTTAISLDNLRINEKLPERLFKFKIPRGVELIKAP